MPGSSSVTRIRPRFSATGPADFGGADLSATIVWLLIERSTGPRRNTAPPIGRASRRSVGKVRPNSRSAAGFRCGRRGALASAAVRDRSPAVRAPFASGRRATGGRWAASGRGGGGLAAEVAPADLPVVLELVGRPVAQHAALEDHVGAIGALQRLAPGMVGDEDPDAPCAQPLEQALQF